MNCDNDFEEDDTHLCLKCQLTINGLENYISHRRSKCQIIVQNVEERVPDIKESSLLSKAENFFTSLELRSSSNTKRLDELIELELQSFQKTDDVVHSSDIVFESNFLDVNNLIPESVNHIYGKGRSILDSDLFASTSSTLVDKELHTPSIINECSDKMLSSNQTITENVTVAYCNDPPLPPPPPIISTSRSTSSLMSYKPNYNTSYSIGKWMPGKFVQGREDVNYFCRTCNRRLSSRILYEKHLRSELHFKRLSEISGNELDDNYSVNCKTWNKTQSESEGSRRPRRNIVLKRYQDKLKTQEANNLRIQLRAKKYKTCRIFCDVCRINVYHHLLGKHLISKYHCSRAKNKNEISKTFILSNIVYVVKISPFQCSLCNFYTNSVFHLIDHFQSNTHCISDKMQTGAYWCVDCKKEEISNLDIIRHLQLVHINNNLQAKIKKRYIFQCSYCDREFPLKIKLIHHLVKIHKINKSEMSDKVNENFNTSPDNIISLDNKSTPELKYLCKTCNSTFLNGNKLKLHRRTCAKICKFCNLVFQDIILYKEHIFQIHDKALHRCKKCNAAFAISQDLTIHVKQNKCDENLLENKLSEYLSFRVIDDEYFGRRFQCHLCDCSYVRRRTLAEHYEVHHLGNMKENRMISKSKNIINLQYNCDICTYKTYYKSHLRRHMTAKHFPMNRERNWNCQHCSKSFYDRFTLKQHEQIHFDNHISCPEENCPFKSHYGSVIRRHVQAVHTKIEQKCKICDFIAKDKAELLRHNKSVHKTKKRYYKCENCNEKYKQLSHYYKHKEKEHGNLPRLKCPYCEYTTISMDSLRKHVILTDLHKGKHLFCCILCNDNGPFNTNYYLEFQKHLANKHGLIKRKEPVINYARGISAHPSSPAAEMTQVSIENPIIVEFALPEGNDAANKNITVIVHSNMNVV